MIKFLSSKTPQNIQFLQGYNFPYDTCHKYHNMNFSIGLSYMNLPRFNETSATATLPPQHYIDRCMVHRHKTYASREDSTGKLDNRNTCKTFSKIEDYDHASA